MENNRNYLKWFEDFFGAVFLTPIKGLYFLMDKSWIIFFVSLLFFIFRPPDQKPYDRIAFVLLILLVVMASQTRRRLVSFKSPIMFPMIGLTMIAAVSAAQSPFNIQTWSILANSFIVPYTMFFLAKAIFRDDRLIQYFFFFSAVIGAYLTFTATAFILNAQFLIFPRYILNPSIVGDISFLNRACGPFLNPVANGTAIIMLGLVSLHWFLKIKRGFLRIFLLSILIALPFGILATMTRGVWLSYLFSIAFFWVTTRYSNIRKAGIMWLVFTFIGVWIATNSTSISGLMFDRLHDQHNIDFRLNLYRAAFDMFKEKPIFGWGTNVTPFVVDRYMVTYRGDVWLHNTYLNILVEQGIVGFLLYALILVYLFVIGRHILHSSSAKNKTMIDRDFVLIFRNILFVYLINGTFVIMNYQFTNALLFIIAGIISARETQLAK